MLRVQKPSQPVSKLGGAPLIADEIVADSVWNGVKQCMRTDAENRQWKGVRRDAQKVLYRNEENSRPGQLKRFRGGIADIHGFHYPCRVGEQRKTNTLP